MLALINRKAYADLVQGTQIDIALSPAQAVIGELLAHVRRGDVEAVHSLRRGAAEALEAVARGDRRPARWSDGASTELKLPEGAQIGAHRARRGRRTRMLASHHPHHDTVIQTGDHVVVFVPRKRMVRDIEAVQVSALFGFRRTVPHATVFAALRQPQGVRQPLATHGAARRGSPHQGASGPSGGRAG